MAKKEEQLDDHEKEVAEELVGAHELAKPVFGDKPSPRAVFFVHAMMAGDVDAFIEDLTAAHAIASEVFGENPPDEAIIGTFKAVYLEGEDEDGEE